MTRGYVPDSTSATRAIALANNARQMVLNRDPRFTDLAAIVTQLTGDLRTLNGNLADAVNALAANTSADQATRTQLNNIGAQVTSVGTELARLDNELEIATAGLAASDAELAARITTVEEDIDSEAIARANADAAEARARADADTANQTKQAAAIAAETAARQAADAALASRAAALENYMPAVTSGRASKPSLIMAAGATTDILVTFDTPAPDTNYVPVPVLDAPNLALFSIVGFPTKTREAVTVRVRTSAVIGVGITLNITVIALKL